LQLRLKKLRARLRACCFFAKKRENNGKNWLCFIKKEELLKTIYSFVDKKTCQEKNGKIVVKILREKPGPFSTNPTIDLLPGLIYNG
jgi:hypothetical protein